jgi:hypothetical protein
MFATGIVGVVFWVWSLFLNDTSDYLLGYFVYALVVFAPIGILVLFFLLLGLLILPGDQPPR